MNRKSVFVSLITSQSTMHDSPSEKHVVNQIHFEEPGSFTEEFDNSQGMKKKKKKTCCERTFLSETLRVVLK